MAGDEEGRGVAHGKNSGLTKWGCLCPSTSRAWASNTSRGGGSGSSRTRSETCPASRASAAPGSCRVTKTRARVERSILTADARIGASRAVDDRATDARPSPFIFPTAADAPSVVIDRIPLLPGGPKGLARTCPPSPIHEKPLSRLMGSGCAPSRQRFRPPPSRRAARSRRPAASSGSNERATSFAPRWPVPPRARSATRSQSRWADGKATSKCTCASWSVSGPHCKHVVAAALVYAARLRASMNAAAAAAAPAAAPRPAAAPAAAAPEFPPDEETTADSEEPVPMADLPGRPGEPARRSPSWRAGWASPPCRTTSSSTGSRPRAPGAADRHWVVDVRRQDAQVKGPGARQARCSRPAPASRRPTSASSSMLAKHEHRYDSRIVLSDEDLVRRCSSCCASAASSTAAPRCSSRTSRRGRRSTSSPARTARSAAHRAALPGRRRAWPLKDVILLAGRRHVRPRRAERSTRWSRTSRPACCASGCSSRPWPSPRASWTACSRSSPPTCRASAWRSRRTTSTWTSPWSPASCSRSRARRRSVRAQLAARYGQTTVPVSPTAVHLGYASGVGAEGRKLYRRHEEAERGRGQAPAWSWASATTATPAPTRPRATRAVEFWARGLASLPERLGALRRAGAQGADAAQAASAHPRGHERGELVRAGRRVRDRRAAVDLGAVRMWLDSGRRFIPLKDGTFAEADRAELKRAADLLEEAGALPGRSARACRCTRPWRWTCWPSSASSPRWRPRRARPCASCATPVACPGGPPRGTQRHAAPLPGGGPRPGCGSSTATGWPASSRTTWVWERRSRRWPCCRRCATTRAASLARGGPHQRARQLGARGRALHPGPQDADVARAGPQRARRGPQGRGPRAHLLRAGASRPRGAQRGGLPLRHPRRGAEHQERGQRDGAGVQVAAQRPPARAHRHAAGEPALRALEPLRLPDARLPRQRRAASASATSSPSRWPTTAPCASACAAASSPSSCAASRRRWPRTCRPRRRRVACCEMEPGQAALYREVLEESRRKVNETIEKVGFKRSRVSILAALMRLRQVCCDPRLLKMPPGTLLPGSAKLERFGELVDGPRRRGPPRARLQPVHRDAGAAQAGAADRRACSYLYLDGRTKDRMARVDDFNRPGRSAALLHQPQGGRHRPQPHRGRLRHPLRSRGGTRPSRTRPPTARTASARRARSSPTSSSPAARWRRRSSACSSARRSSPRACSARTRTSARCSPSRTSRTSSAGE